MSTYYHYYHYYYYYFHYYHYHCQSTPSTHNADSASSRYATRRPDPVQHKYELPCSGARRVLTHQPWHQFSEVNALVHLLYNGNIQGTFENMCRRRAHALPWDLRPRAVVAARPLQGSRASAAAHRASARRAACHRYAHDLLIERGRRARQKRATFLAPKKNSHKSVPLHIYCGKSL
jgi:hypothetical protein